MATGSSRPLAAHCMEHCILVRGCICVCVSLSPPPPPLALSPPRPGALGRMVGSYKSQIVVIGGRVTFAFIACHGRRLVISGEKNAAVGVGVRVGGGE